MLFKHLFPIAGWVSHIEGMACTVPCAGRPIDSAKRRRSGLCSKRPDMRSVGRIALNPSHRIV